MNRVLVVDDEESIRMAFSKMLTTAGYDVIKAAQLMDARRIIDENQLDVAIVDRLLLSDNGMDLIEYINKTQPFCTTILMSGFPNFKSACEGFKHNLFAYLQKPIKKDELLGTVKDAAQNSREKQKTHNYEQQFIQTQKMTTMGMLSSGIVHDFNNLLMTINGLAELSCLDLPEKSPVLENLKKIHKAGEQGSKLSKQLLSYIRQNKEKPVQIQIQSLIKGTLTFLRMAMPIRIKISEKMGAGNDIVLVHPTQIQQVIMNLGINAMHAMENEKGTLEVSFESVKLDTSSMEHLDMKKSDCIKISMKDTGCGMDEETLKQIFTPFFSTRPKGMGTGIGLSITTTILKNHGGAITAESQPGKGSKFHVYLPSIIQ